MTVFIAESSMRVYGLLRDRSRDAKCVIDIAVISISDGYLPPIM
jgi:hypothetical protein